jgi:hypothetical protein
MMLATEALADLFKLMLGTECRLATLRTRVFVVAEPGELIDSKVCQPSLLGTMTGAGTARASRRPRAAGDRP